MPTSSAFKMLQEFVSIPSVSADPKRKPVMFSAVHFLVKRLSNLGFEIKTLQEKDEPPTIIARYDCPQATKTIGIYGHYDVQPEDPLDEWSTPPFTLTSRNGSWFGRGVADNKGHIIQNLIAIENLIHSGRLKANILFCIEGEEECGSAHLGSHLKLAHEEVDKVDVWMITDVGMHAEGVPQIVYALRGLCYFEITIETGSRDLHSGVYGNSVLNPIQVLANLFAQMKDVKTGEVLIPGFYDKLRSVDSEELENLKNNCVPDTTLLEETGSHILTSLRDLPPYLAPKLLPSLDVHGFSSGHTGEGPKTIIPHTATAQFSCRLVEKQTVAEIEKLVKTFVTNHLPKCVTHKLNVFSYDDPFYTSIKNKYIQQAATILSTLFQAETMFIPEGGSIPVASLIRKLGNTPIVLTGFILPNSNLHAPNENINEALFFTGVQALERIYEAWGGHFETK